MHEAACVPGIRNCDECLYGCAFSRMRGHRTDRHSRHGLDGLRTVGNVADNSVTLLNPQRLEAGSKLLHSGPQLTECLGLDSLSSKPLGGEVQRCLRVILVPCKVSPLVYKYFPVMKLVSF